MSSLNGFGVSLFYYWNPINSQASVPHQDLSLVMSMVPHWPTIGNSIGYAISAPIWSSKLSGYFREFILDTYTDEEVYDFYKNMSLLRYAL